MSQLPTDQIVCSDCGTTFLFSSAEAAFFNEKGLTPPKRCKACRIARKERGGGGSRGGAREGAPRGPSPTGERSEYRSPMPVAEPPAWGGTPWSRGPGSPDEAPRRRPIVRDGEYRSPRGPRPPSGQAQGGEGAPRREGFPIVCKACGAQSTVPFRPVQGRDVFCRDCYKSRAGA
jgi:CxxC-x17-CxxC domain-containing protein